MNQGMVQQTIMTLERSPADVAQPRPHVVMNCLDVAPEVLPLCGLVRTSTTPVPAHQTGVLHRRLADDQPVFGLVSE